MVNWAMGATLPALLQLTFLLMEILNKLHLLIITHVPYLKMMQSNVGEVIQMVNWVMELRPRGIFQVKLLNLGQRGHIKKGSNIRSLYRTHVTLYYLGIIVT